MTIGVLLLLVTRAPSPMGHQQMVTWTDWMTATKATGGNCTEEGSLQYAAPLQCVVVTHYPGPHMQLSFLHVILIFFMSVMRQLSTETLL